MLGGSRLWHHPDFLKLWSGQTISVIGGEITVLALPTLAILQFHTSALVIGLLVGTQRLPFLVLTLFTGVLADRVRRRPLMIIADAGRAIALASMVVVSVALGWMMAGERRALSASRILEPPGQMSDVQSSWRR